MKNIIIRICASLCFLCAGKTPATNVIGYFSIWGIYSDPYTPLDVPYDKLTHIQYAFFIPEADGTISSSDQNADKRILCGPSNDSTKSLIYRAHQEGVKVMPSIGGFTGSSNFPSLAGSSQTRSHFCSSARALIEKYNFDGIDIDWEYPGYAKNNGTPQDAENFVLLLEELRDTLDAIDGDHKLITLAIAGSSYYGQNFLVEQFVDFVDFISIMTYDYSGSWDETSWHNSPLYSYATGDNWSLDRAMQYYTNRGIPKSKLNIGMAFYGRTFAGCEGPGMSFTGPGSGESGEAGMVFFSTVDYNIQSGTYTKHWDSLAGVPYCLSAEGEYCTYDDTTSIRMKAEYCIQNGYGGAIIWELKAGRVMDGSQPLLEAVANVFNPPAKITGNFKNKPAFSVPIICNRKSSIDVLIASENVFFSIFDMWGRRITSVSGQKNNGKYTIHYTGKNGMRSGNYILQIKTGKEMYRTVIPLMN